MKYLIRQVHAKGRSALASEATMAALIEATVGGSVVVGAYLEWSDPDARGGMGKEKWTHDQAKAKRFDSFEAATACWNAQSTKRPFRDDGRPNKPMTAYSVTFEKVDE